jgi:hypothetical protein
VKLHLPRGSDANEMIGYARFGDGSVNIRITVNTALYILLGAWAISQAGLIVSFGWAYLAYYRYLFRRLASDPTQLDKGGQGSPFNLKRWIEAEWRKEQADPVMEQLRRTVWRRMRFAIAGMALVAIIIVVGFMLIAEGSPTS